MKVVGKAKDGRILLMVTKWEYARITEAIFEWSELCHSENVAHAKEFGRLEARVYKAMGVFESLPVIDNKQSSRKQLKG